MEYLVPIVCAIIGSGAATAIVNAIVNANKKETGESQGIRWLMQDRLEQQALKHIDRGFISYEDLRNWTRGHYIYHDLLGGNGDLNTLKETLHNLYKESSGKEI
jgi:hypothetical protein